MSAGFDPARISDLAVRCEAAEGPDRVLDRDIELSLPGVLPHPNRSRIGYLDYVISGAMHPDYCPGQGYVAGRYTESLDAALKLYVQVPERVPANPCLAAAEALWQRAEAA